ncbi:hypothetical protein D2E25_1120 [Bifidobacterium goeldii]|uniref:DUF3027 domain-containing protein n=1 Tax=Bifidobacterium goeldii TaxID=2306975 RepID=A0A430FJZ4_9BIFI|nr:DUF3027 domain-containing protein [Bifidobacterium goeldii]RSX53147.1 hypothetical protein D2E25_1120 [Bifidobacterium goeldii]
MPETTKDPESIARAVALEVAEEPDHVGDFVQAIDLGDNVTDFRFTSLLRGYEGWQWSVTLYHDVELDEWTVNESSLTPTDQALRPPAWIPWKDRLLPTDLSVTDSIGTEPDDPRLEDGFQENTDSASKQGTELDAAAGDTGASTTADNDTNDDSVNADSAASADNGAQLSATAPSDSAAADNAVSSDNTVLSDNTVPSDSAVSSDSAAQSAEAAEDATAPVSSPEDIDDAVSAFDLSRRHVLTPLGRAQTAKRWYEGPRGPKSLSTKTAAGNLCSTCGFCVPIQGELGVMFGVCANKWSPDDGRVVSLDHGCGEHSEIDPPEPSHLWIQSKPAFDDLHIDVIAQTPREEHDEVDLIEQLHNTDAEQPADDDASETDTATETAELIEVPSDAEGAEESSEQTAEEAAGEEAAETVAEETVEDIAEETSEAVSFESQDQDTQSEVPAEPAADMELADAQTELVSDAVAEQPTGVAEPATEESATEESATEEPVEEPASADDLDTADEEDNNAESNADYQY